MPIAGPGNGALLCTPCITYSVQQPFLKNVLMFIFERERDRQTERGRQREKETQNPKQFPGFGLSAQSLKWGSYSGIAS